jgi:hypothetical protein
MAKFGEGELVEVGLGSIAEIFGLDPKQLQRRLLAARAINWGRLFVCDAKDPTRAGGAFKLRWRRDILFRRSPLPGAGHGDG